MSDHHLAFVSANPVWQPAQAVADQAVALFWSISPHTDEVKATFFDDVTLIHPIQNWDGVSCPYCAADLEGWWYESVYRADWTYAPDQLETETPCCWRRVSINDLAYGYPAAFGRFTLTAINPRALITGEHEKELAACLGSGLIKVWQHW